MIPSLLTAPEMQDSLRQAAQRRRVDLGLTQADLAARAGVALGTLKRFEQSGEIALHSLLQLAEALECLDAFAAVFPARAAQSLDDLDRQNTPPRRVRKRRS